MIHYAEGSGVGAAFAAFAPLGLAYVFLSLLSHSPLNRTHVTLLLFFGTSVLAWWGFMQRMPRFGLPIAVFACVLSAPLVGTLQAHKKRAFEILLVISISATSVISGFVPFHAMAGRIRTREWERA